MHADETRLVRQAFLQFRDRNSRSIARKNGAMRRHAFDVAEHLLLELQPLGHCFYDELSITQRAGQIAFVTQRAAE